MSLTVSPGPLAGSTAAEVNYTIEGPAHRLLMHAFPRRVRAVFGGATVLDTYAGQLLHETGLPPMLYVPVADVREDLLRPTAHRTHCPFKGDASYWTVEAGGRSAVDAVWGYPEPVPGAAWLRGYRSFYADEMDAWFDEDEPVLGHLVDPYHRVDARRSSRSVLVRQGSQVLAETTSPLLVSETGLPNRFYVPIDDVRMDLLSGSDTRTTCSYKGVASYFSVAGADPVADVAWQYAEPLPAVVAIGRYLCFDGAKVSVEVTPA